MVEDVSYRKGRSGASRDRVASVSRRIAQASTRPGSGSNAKSFRH
ncbi:hypothetical protein LA76x_2463 [Lysobacter antibioticus]|uniref:Uncharacterized protein n=1 Tax=Lysobacter antibioticus TaxID=84531 RepID=A0A0S2FAN9_LYSAN|nr:hypothetical protein LA76x_2463 [Lysobacter antibioticus]